MQTQGCGYLHELDNDIADGMVFVVSNWGLGGIQDWLTKDRCNWTCNVSPNESIKNISIKVGTVHPSGGGYDPTAYNFGNACAHVTDGQCPSENCPSVDHCKWSWLKNDWSGGPSADCRCDIAV